MVMSPMEDIILHPAPISTSNPIVIHLMDMAVMDMVMETTTAHQ